jgi:predicted esterase
MRGRIFVAAMFLCTTAVCGTQAGDAKGKLTPGVPLEFDVPAAPPSLAHLKRGTQGEAVRMTIKLPATYEASRTYPVLVFLGGGDGGMGGELNMAEPFLGGGDYILCNMPLFKRDVKGETYDEQLSVTPLDGPVALPAFRLLLDELRSRVPNIDEARSVLAGFSNGGNCVGLLLWAEEADLRARFSTYIIIEGGFWLASDRPDPTSKQRFQPAALSGLQGKRVLVMYGDQTQPPDRIPWIADAKKTVAALRKAGVTTTEMPMTNVGHDFPPAEMAKARAWVLGQP